MHISLKSLLLESYISKVTDNPNFKRWFDDSKIVDNNGNPLKVYHGSSNAIFSDFKTSSGYEYGNGAYFTPEPARAAMYAGYNRRLSKILSFIEDGGDINDLNDTDLDFINAGVYPVFLSIKNPIYTNEFYSLDGATNNDKNKEARKKGYDGLIKQWHNGTIVEIVAFYPTQIKSIFNNGDYNPNNPDISK